MPFVEFQPDAPLQPPPSAWHRMLFVLGLPLMLVCNFFPPLARLVLGCTRTHVESDGWLAEWTTPRCVCAYCGAEIHRFELHGAPSPLPPPWTAERCSVGSFVTPVGVFTNFKGRWRRGHWEPNPYIVRGEFDAADEELGWYPSEHHDPTRRPDTRFISVGMPVFRKAGTPAHWCLQEPYDAPPCWVDPCRLAERLAQHDGG